MEKKVSCLSPMELYCVFCVFLATSLAQGMAAAPFPRPHLQGAPNHTQTHEMTIPNDLIGCIIGRGGAKINEIR